MAYAAQITAAILGVSSVGIAALVLRARKRGPQSSKCFAVVGAYDAVLLAVWAGATLLDRGYGVAYFPALVLTAPWSFIAIPLALKTPLGALFTSGSIANFFENFFLFVILCGGINNVLLAFAAKRWLATERHPKIARGRTRYKSS